VLAHAAWRYRTLKTPLAVNPKDISALAAREQQVLAQFPTCTPSRQAVGIRSTPDVASFDWISHFERMA
jgi:hypothetical protein